MATYNITPSQTIVPTSAQSEANGRVPAIVEAVVDFNSGIVTTPTGVTALSGTSGTVINMLNVPAGFTVLQSGVEVLLADTAGNSGTVQVKVGAATQGSAVAPSSTGYLATAGTVTPVVPSGSNALASLTVGTGTINAICRLFLVMLDTRAKPGTGVAIGTQTNPSGQAAVAMVDPVKNYTGTNKLVYVL